MATKNTPAKIEENDSQYLAILNDSEFDVAEVLSENLDGGLDAFQLPRIKMPTSAATSWTVPTIDGPETQKYIEGILIYQKTWRTYWQHSFGEGEANQPPDCSSKDGKVGVGNPGGPCKTCAYAQWGSGKDGNGQACRQIKALFILMPGDLLPTLVMAPPTSIRSVTDWLALVTSKSRKPYWMSEIKLGLVKDRNSGGIEYSKIEVDGSRIISPEEATAIKEYRDAILPHIAEMDVVIDAPETQPSEESWEPDE